MRSSRAGNGGTLLYPRSFKARTNPLKLLNSWSVVPETVSVPRQANIERLDRIKRDVRITAGR